MEPILTEEDKHNQICSYARKIMNLSRDTITMHYRFFDAALSRLTFKESIGLLGFSSDMENIYYDPYFVVSSYLDEPGLCVHSLLHILLHCIFLHPFFVKEDEELNEEYWNIACDIAVENIILELKFQSATLTTESEQLDWISKIHKWQANITAQRLYKDFCVNGISQAAKSDFLRLFTMDIHESRSAMLEPDEILLTEEQWKKISERIQTDIKTFSKDSNNSESFVNNIDETNKRTYDYAAILSRFMVTAEEMKVNDDEFDYIYYTYGLRRYGNLPLIEPLEYKEDRKVREFAIVIDTSASCKGEIVQGFLQRTYEILKSSENFFHSINVHIIQCDKEVREDTKITNDAEFLQFIHEGRLTGFGATDFRPAFAYVEKLREEGELKNLKGLIYFTDGYGVYPGVCPDYDVIFAFVEEDEYRPDVPSWAIKVVLN